MNLNLNILILITILCRSKNIDFLFESYIKTLLFFELLNTNKSINIQFIDKIQLSNYHL